MKVVLPLHPRTKRRAEEFGLSGLLSGLLTSDPLSFLDMAALEREAKLVVTDSGGVQKEAYFHKVPCVTLRSETEWSETVDAGWNVLCDGSPDALLAAARAAAPGRPIAEYGDGHAAEAMREMIKSWKAS
jgi:UDP-GlcNAc3NAcA epimerase